MQAPRAHCAKACRPCANNRASANQQYALLTKVLDVLKLDDNLRTSIIPDEMMRATSKEWRQIQRDNVPIKFSGYEPAEVVRKKLEMFFRDGFRVTEVNLSSGENTWFKQDQTKIGDQGMRILEPVLTKCPLQKLNISGNGISDRGVIPLALVTAWSPSLTHLVLNNNKLGDSGAATLGNALKHCPSLQLLSVDFIDMKAQGFLSISSGLAANSKADQPSVFTSLSAKYNNIHHHEYEVGDDRENFAEPFYSALFNLTDHCSNLQQLDFTGNDIMTLGEIAQSLKNAKKLTSLNLSSNNLEFEDSIFLEKFMSALETHPTLTELDLSVNEMNDSACDRLAQVLPRCTTLAILNLEGIDLLDDNARTISDAVTRSPNLTSLKVSGDYMSVNGVKALRQAWLHGDHGLDIRYPMTSWLTSDEDDSDESNA